MAQAIATPVLTETGVAFTVMTVDFIKRDCLISKEALEALSPHRTTGYGPIDIFQAYEARICGVARRMIAAEVKGTPLLLGPHSFH